MKTLHLKERNSGSMAQAGAAALALLFGYAALSKLLEYDRALLQMRNQVFPEGIAEVLTWAVPMVELGVVALLLYRPTRRLGLYVSSFLLTVFSLYIVLAVTGFFGRIPCSCGGILESLGYWEHLVFNLLFLALSIMAIRSHSNAGTWEARGDGPSPGRRKGGGG